MGAAPGAGDTLTLSVTGTREELLSRQAAGCAYLARNRVRALRLAAPGLGLIGVVLIVAGSVPTGIALVLCAGIVAMATRRGRLERQSNFTEVLGEKAGVLALPATTFPTPEAQARTKAPFTSWIRAAEPYR